MDINTVSKITSWDLYKVISEALEEQTETMKKLWARFAEVREENEVLAIADAFYASVKAESAQSEANLSSYIHPSSAPAA